MLILRILYIEDDESVAELFKIVMESHDYQVDLAYTGNEGLSLHSSNPYDVVAVDYQLPDITGLDICRELLLDDPDLPTLMVTGKGSQKLLIEALNLGIAQYIQKDELDVYLELIPSVVKTLITRGAISQQKRQAEEDLKQSLKDLDFQKNALDEHAIVSTADVKGDITYVNDKFCEISGYSREELIGQNHRLLKSDYHPPGFYKTLWNNIANGQVWHGEICNKRKGGGHYWVSATILPFLNDNGRPQRYVSIRTDITKQKEQELDLEQAQLVAHIGSWRLDFTNNHLVWSDQIFEIFGISKEKFGASLEAFFDCIHPDDLEDVQAAFQASVDEDVPYDIEHRIVKRDNGDVRWVHERCLHERRGVGEVIRSIGTVQDITKRKEAEEKLRQSEQNLLQRTKDLELTNAMMEKQAQELTHLAEDLHQAKEELEVLAITDRLTGLHNRLKLDESFISELNRSIRYGHPLSVVILDLDHFKSVNDTYGHQIGDEVLMAVAKILKGSSRAVDVPGRWGGEEFLVICPETDLLGAKALAEKIRQSIEAYSFPQVGRKTASFGVAQFTEGDSIDTLTHRADEALYQAKITGRNRVEVR